MVTPLRLVGLAIAVGCIAGSAISAAAAPSWEPVALLAAYPGSDTDNTDTDTDTGSTTETVSDGSDDSGLCQFTAAPGHLEGSGHESQVIMINRSAYMGCGGGPTISLKQVDGDAATFALDDSTLRVTSGSTERLGPYQVHVIEVRGDVVDLELSEPQS